MKIITSPTFALILIVFVFLCDLSITTNALSQETLSKTTSETGTVVDIDGNTYKTVRIGNQLWMAENLKVTHYRNGDAIPNITNKSKWENTTNGAYCNFNDNEVNVATYGRLYNWYTVNDNRKIAPDGWHVPTNDEWKTLVVFLGGSSFAGGKMKESGTVHWRSPNTSATNESGFSGLPGGYRYSFGHYIDMGNYAYFWSSTEYHTNYAWSRGLDFNLSVAGRNGSHKKEGISVRCIKDQD